MFSSAQKNETCLKNVMNSLIALNIITPVFADKVFGEFSAFLQKEFTLHKDKFKEFDRNCTRLDHFYFHNGIGIEKYSHLAHIVQILLTLSHGQASVE